MKAKMSRAMVMSFVSQPIVFTVSRIIEVTAITHGKEDKCEIVVILVLRGPAFNGSIDFEDVDESLCSSHLNRLALEHLRTVLDESWVKQKKYDDAGL